MSNKKRIKRKIYQIERNLAFKRIRVHFKGVNCKIKFINLEGNFVANLVDICDKIKQAKNINAFF